MTERSLLLVDDEENILSALTRLLRREGYQIFRATSGMAGLELLSQHDIGVIVSDQRMPELTGVEFLSKVKELYPGTVRIVLSGYTDLNSVTDAINQGAVYKFLTKPWDDDLLRKNISEAFQHFELRKENQRLTQELQNANALLSGINKDLKCQVAAEVAESSSSHRKLDMAQEVLDCLPCGIVATDGNGLLVMINPAARELIGNKESVEIGLLAQDVLPGPLIDLLMEKSSESDDIEIVQINGVTMRVWHTRLGKLSGGGGKALVLTPKSDS